jgi:antitoxin PrlF
LWQREVLRISQVVEISRITSKHQATIPADVRATLGVGAGDTLTWSIEEGQVVVRKARPLDLAFAAAASATLVEWGSEADEDAWRDL